MSEIEIEEYIRTREGYLGKLIAINKQDYNYLTIDCKRRVRRDFSYPDSYLYLKNEDIVKHSKNIKDLIEEGDIVVYQIKGLKHTTYIDIVKEYKDIRTLKNKLRIANYSLEQINIKQILTKEQFLQNSYEVEK